MDWYRECYYDTELELYYLQMRFYDPRTNRFISADIETRKKMMWDVIERAFDYIRVRKAFSRIDELKQDLYDLYWAM